MSLRLGHAEGYTVNSWLSENFTLRQSPTFQLVNPANSTEVGNGHL